MYVQVTSQCSLFLLILCMNSFVNATSADDTCVRIVHMAQRIRTVVKLARQIDSAELDVNRACRGELANTTHVQTLVDNDGTNGNRAKRQADETTADKDLMDAAAVLQAMQNEKSDLMTQMNEQSGVIPVAEFDKVLRQISAGKLADFDQANMNQLEELMSMIDMYRARADNASITASRALDTIARMTAFVQSVVGQLSSRIDENTNRTTAGEQRVAHMESVMNRLAASTEQFNTAVTSLTRQLFNKGLLEPAPSANDTEAETEVNNADMQPLSMLKSLDDPCSDSNRAKQNNALDACVDLRQMLSKMIQNSDDQAERDRSAQIRMKGLIIEVAQLQQKLGDITARNNDLERKMEDLQQSFDSTVSNTACCETTEDASTETATDTASEDTDTPMTTDRTNTDATPLSTTALEEETPEVTTNLMSTEFTSTEAAADSTESDLNTELTETTTTSTLTTDDSSTVVTEQTTSDPASTDALETTDGNSDSRNDQTTVAVTNDEQPAERYNYQPPEDLVRLVLPNRAEPERHERGQGSQHDQLQRSRLPQTQYQPQLPITDLQSGGSGQPNQNQYQPNPSQYQRKQNQYQPNQNQYQPNQNQYQPSQNQYQPSQNQYQPSQNQYQPSQNQYQTNQNRYQTNQNQYQPSQNQYQSRQNQYQSSQNQYQPSQNQYQPSQNRYQPSQNQYQPSQNQYQTNQNQYQTNRNKDQDTPAQAPARDEKAWQAWQWDGGAQNIAAGNGPAAPAAATNWNTGSAGDRTGQPALATAAAATRTAGQQLTAASSVNHNQYREFAAVSSSAASGDRSERNSVPQSAKDHQSSQCRGSPSNPLPGLDLWCHQNCPDNCPRSHCICDQ